MRASRAGSAAGVSPAALGGLVGESSGVGDIAAANEACGGRGEEDGTVRVVGGDPVEELLRPEQRLVDEAGLRVEVEVG